MGYFANFMVYTLAMIGIIAIALVVFKNSNSMGASGKSKYMKVIDSISLAPRKKLYIVSTGNERFLIASDIDKTNLISKLETNSNEMSLVKEILPSNNKSTEEDFSTKSFKETMNSLPKSRYMDQSNIGIKSSLLSNKSETQYTSVIKSLAMKMKQ